MKRLLILLPMLLGADEMMAPKGQSKYVAPHKPVTRYAALKASHAGQGEWRQVIVDDEHLRSEYIQMKAGRKTPRLLHPDTRAWWVVMEGEIRCEIEKQEPFTAKKGSMVQVPFATLYTMEVVGDKPAIVFETNIAGAKSLYEKGYEPPKLPGAEWIKVNFRRKMGEYDKGNKPHVTFEEAAALNEQGKVKGTQRIVEDARGAANFIYGYEKNLPKLDPKVKGHYHAECAEYWLIMAGQIRYPLEGQDVIITEVGDVVYAPKYTWHAPRWYGPGPSCRLAMNGYPEIAHLFE